MSSQQQSPHAKRVAHERAAAARDAYYKNRNERNFGVKRAKRIEQMKAKSFLPDTGPGRRTILNDKQRSPLTASERVDRMPGGMPGSRECLRRAWHAALPQHGGMA